MKHGHRWTRTARRAWLPALIAAASIFFSAPAEATCGSASCFLVTGTAEGAAMPGGVRFDLSYSYVEQTRKLSGTDEVDEVLVPKVDFERGELEPDHHREIGTWSSLLRLDVAYGATDRLTVLGVLPLINDKDHEHFDEPGTPEEHFSNTDGTSGFGDVQAGVRYDVLVASEDLLFGGIMAKFPTGSYRLRDSEGDINEPSIQPGTGSYDFIGSLYYSHHPSSSAFEWFASGSYRFNTENDLDYRFGGETILTAGVRHGPGKLSWSFQLNGRHAARDEFLGEGVPSTGSIYLNATPGLRFTSATGISLYGFVQIPVYEDVNEAQLAPDYGLVVGISRTF